ncbi:MAG: hypothetical protein MK160_03920 [Rhodobacteraceae bacterium]|nr:hypothetical protein [Paracoccaceae bacterium]
MLRLTFPGDRRTVPVKGSSEAITKAKVWWTSGSGVAVRIDAYRLSPDQDNAIAQITGALLPIAPRAADHSAACRWRLHRRRWRQQAVPAC